MNISTELRISATAIMAPLSIAGVLINLISVICLLRLRSFRNSFGYLTAFHAFSDASLLFIFAVWSTPTTLLRIPSHLRWLNELFGSFSILFQHLSFHSSLTIAINRFLAISFPVFYRHFFTTRVAISCLLFITIYSLLYWSVFFFDGCKFYFNDETIIWQFSETECGENISFYVDFLYCVGLFSVESLLDIITLIQLITANIKLSRLATLNATATDVARKREILYFVQAAANTLVYVLEITCFHLVNPYMTTPFSQFMSSTFAWACGHFGGGMVLIIFNSPIRKRLLHPSKIWRSETISQNLIRVTVAGTSEKRKSAGFL